MANNKANETPYGVRSDGFARARMGTKKEAQAAGEKFYFTGIPCKRGHIDYRYACGGSCVSCVRENKDTDEARQKNREWYQRAKKAHQAKMREYRSLNVENLRERGRRYYEANREQICARKSGSSPPTRPMPDACELCGSPPREGKSLSIDHNHKTGMFRGWLCDLCNTAIGKLGDDAEGLRRALRYLEAAEGGKEDAA